MQTRPVSDICDQRMPGRLRPVGDQRQRQQRQRRHQAQPGEQVEHRHVPRPPQQQIADREADRRDHQHGEGADAEIVADGAADHQQADRWRCRCRRSASRVGISRNAIAAKPIVNSAWLCTITLVRPTGTPCAMAIGLRQKLAEKQRAADRDQQRPGHLRACARTGTAPRRWQSAAPSSAPAKIRRARSGLPRRQAPRSPPPGRRCTTSAGFIAFSSSARRLSVCATDRCRAAARDNRPIPA